MSGYRAPYTLAEDKIILRYILDGDYIQLVMGNSIWKQMESANICPERTWQSLKNRFRRHIMPFVTRPEYQLEPHEKDLIKAVLRTSGPTHCESCHAPLKDRRVVTTRRGSDSTDDDIPTTVSDVTNKPSTYTRPKSVKPTERTSESFFNLDMSDSSDTS